MMLNNPRNIVKPMTFQICRTPSFQTGTRLIFAIGRQYGKMAQGSGGEVLMGSDYPGEVSERLGLLSNLRVALVSPKFPGNLGMTARAMKNCGLSDLRLVGPRGLPRPRIRTRSGRLLLDKRFQLGLYARRASPPGRRRPQRAAVWPAARTRLTARRGRGRRGPDRCGLIAAGTILRFLLTSATEERWCHG